MSELSRESILNAVKHGFSIKDAPDSWRKDADLALDVVKVSGKELRFFSDEIRANKDIVLAAVSSNNESKEAYEAASKELQFDKDIAMAVARNSDNGLKIVNQVFKYDKDVAEEAILHHNAHLREAGRELQEDINFVKNIIHNKPQFSLEVCYKLKENKEFMLEEIQRGILELHVAGERLRGDREVVLAAIDKDPHALEFASEELRGEKDVVLAAVNKWPSEFKYVSDELQNDPDVLAAVNEPEDAQECDLPDFHSDIKQYKKFDISRFRHKSSSSTLMDN